VLRYSDGGFAGSCLGYDHLPRRVLHRFADLPEQDHALHKTNFFNLSIRHTDLDLSQEERSYLPARNRPSSTSA
jgi:hypothetical protein